MVSTGSVEASRAGVRILEEGGNAVAYNSRTGVFTGVGDPRRNGFAVGPRVVAEPGD